MQRSSWLPASGALGLFNGVRIQNHARVCGMETSPSTAFSLRHVKNLPLFQYKPMGRREKEMALQPQGGLHLGHCKSVHKWGRCQKPEEEESYRKGS